MPFWHRIAIAAGVFITVWLLERAVDWWLARRTLPPESMTRYRVLRRSVSTAILVIGFFSALLVIPQVRAVAGGLLASSAVLALIVGFASQRTLANFVAGILIAITQPIRLGDRVSYGGLDGNATVTVRAAAPDASAALRLESELRLRAHARLRALGVFA